MDEHGLTRVLAGSFVLHEDEDSFSWAYSAFTSSFGSSPKVFFTNLDAAMAKAKENVWPEAIHLICVFHVWKNFYTHIHPLFISRRQGWETASKMWWNMCKKTDESEQDGFDERFNSLIQFIKDKGTVNTKMPWLHGLLAKKNQWAACYTWRYRSFGIHSTQRAEAIHSSIARFCSKTSPFLAITMNLEQMAFTHAMKSEILLWILCLKKLSNSLHCPCCLWQHKYPRS